MPSNARMDFGGTGRALAEFHMPNDYLASDLPGYAAATRSCHAALPTPPWRHPRLEGAQCPARRDRCLPHHHPQRAARAQDPRCATRRAARALPPDAIVTGGMAIVCWQSIVKSWMSADVPSSNSWQLNVLKIIAEVDG